jgi:hypothetical protein
VGNIESKNGRKHKTQKNDNLSLYTACGLKLRHITLKQKLKGRETVDWNRGKIYCALTDSDI